MPGLKKEGRRKRICVVGAGIAGLSAAYELTQLGHEVNVLEASDRVGGRILTHHFDGENYGELGAMRIPLTHQCTYRYIRLFNLPVHEFVQENARGYYHLRGMPMEIAPWVELRLRNPSLYPNVRPHIGDPEPPDALGALVGHLFGKLSTSAERWEAFSGTLSSPTTSLFDRLSIWQHVQGLALPRRASPLLTTPPASLNDEEWEYLGRASGQLFDEKVSYLEALVDTVPHLYPAMFQIVGGMDVLTNSLVSHTDAPIQLRARVIGLLLASDGDGVEVVWSSPTGVDRRQFDYVVCTIPASAAARIDFRGALPAAQFEALTNLSYQSAAKSLLYCKRRIWEQRDAIYGGATYTDMPVQQIWYPSGNAKPAKIRRHSRPTQVIKPDGTPLDIKVIRDWVAQIPGQVGPGVLTAAYMWGGNARRFASMAPAERDALVLGCLERIHPGINKETIGIKHWSWDEQVNPGGGAWAAFGPGEHQRYQSQLVQPLPPPPATGRIYFAGEHLGIAHAWIQAAIQTAMGAVWHIQRSP